MIFGARDDGFRAIIETEDAASRRRAPGPRPVSAPTVGLAHTARAADGRFGRVVRRRAVGAPSRARLRLAALALAALALGAAEQAAAQTEVWTATLTPGADSAGSLGCNNNIPAARCRSTSVLSDDDFTHKSTDYTITALYLRTNGTLQIDVDTDFTTEIDALTLMVGTTSLLLSAATDDGNRRKVWSSTGLSLTAGTAVTVKLVMPAPPSLVSNIGQTVSSSPATLGTTQDLSQGFTTATTAGTLDSIEVKFAAANDGSAHPTVTLHKDSPTSTAIATLTAPSGTIAATAANYTYTAPSNTTLIAATTYYVVLEGSDDDLAPQATTSDNEDSGGETGWSVANGYGYRTASSVGAFTTSSSALLIRVNGTAKAVTTPGAPTSFMARAGDGEVTLSWGPPANIGGGAITNYRYRHTTGSIVASTRHWTDVPDGSDAGSSAADETGFTITGLTNGTEYAFEVLAENSAGEGAEAAQTATPAAETCAAPNFGTRRNFWTGTVTVGTIEINMGVTTNYGFSGTVGDLDDKTFRIGSNDHEIDTVTVTGVGGNVLVSLKDADLSTAEKASLRLHVCNASYDFSAASARGGHSYFFTADLDWSSISSRTLYLSLPANNAATGKPTITGPGTDPNKVGSTLTAAKGDIADADGLPAADDDLMYQWVRVDGPDETDIPNADTSTYTLALDDTGLKVKVKVSFKDQLSVEDVNGILSGEETRTSDAYPSGATTVEGLPKITIAPGQAKATGKLDYVHYTLTRAGATTATQAVTVTLEPPAGNDWNIPDANLSHAVTFAADSATATLSILLGDVNFRNIGFSSSATMSGTLTARIGDVAGFDNRDTAEVEVVVVTGPAWVFSLTETEYSFAEDGGAQTVTVEARATSPDIPSPTGTTNSNAHLVFSVVAKAGTATATDYTTLSIQRSLAKSAFSADTDGHQHARIDVTFTPTDDTLVEPHETLTLELKKSITLPLIVVNVQAPDGTKGAKADYPATIKDDDTGLLSMAVTSTPSLMATGSTEADLYGADNMIEFTATFNNKVTVSGTPEFEFVLGTTNKRAAYVRGSDSTELVFSYTVVTADTDSDGISWAANKIVKVSSATIREMGETTDAVITHALQGALSGHKVDGSQAGVDRPAVSIAAVHDTAAPFIAHPEFKVTIAEAQTAAVTVNLTITQPADTTYIAATQTIEIPANDTSATGKFASTYTGATGGTLTATVAAGTGYMPAESPGNAANVEMVAPGKAALLGFEWSAATYGVTEGDTASVSVKLRTGANVPRPRETFTVYEILTGGAVTNPADTATPSASGDPGDYTHTSAEGGDFAPGDWRQDGSVFEATKSHTIQTTEDSVYEGTERFKITLSNDTDDDVGAVVSGKSETIVTITDDETLEVTGVAVSSTPSSGSTYGVGERISFKATFSGPVKVTGTPRFALSLGGVTKQADYASGSDSTELVFSYTVVAGDNDADGVSWSANALSLNGGTIKFMTSVVANRVDAALTHAAGAAQSGHKVDTPPVLGTRTVDGAELTLTYNETLDGNSTPAASAFTVTVGGTTANLASSNPVRVSGTTVTLTLATALTAQATNVRVRYVKPSSNPIRDAGGTDAAGFSNQVVDNLTADGPTLTGAEVDGTGLVLTFDDPLNTASAPASTAFTVKVGGTAVTQASSGPVAIVGSTVTLTLATAVAASDTVTVSYAVPQTNPLQDTDNLDAAAFDDRPVTNRTIAVPDAPGSFRVTAGDGQAELLWAAPFDGNSPITKYRYRYAVGTSVPQNTAWIDVPDSDNDSSLADERNVTITGLTNETEYAFEIQAVNSAGGGPAASASATPVEDPNLPSVVLELRAQTGDGTVTLEWGAPLRTGSHDSIDYYEYRYAEGSSVPTSTSWASVDEGRYPFAQITGLENGRSYAFEVRAVNNHGFKGAAATLTATPRAVVEETLPSAPRGLSAAGSLYGTAGVSELAQVELRWELPADLGNTSLIRYEYRYAAGGDSPSSWLTSGDSVEVTAGRTQRVLTVRNLEPGTAYRFEVRAVTLVGAGSPASAQTTTPSSDVTIIDDETLEVTGVAVSSTPTGSSTYGAGETISFKATFSGPVTVTGTPQIPFSLGGVTKQAAYVSGSDSTELVFSYTVVAGDNDADGVSWSANALSLNGGTIKFMTSVVANRVDAALTHAAGAAQSGHKVDTPPHLLSQSVSGTALTLTYNETLDANSRPAASAFTVTVGGATAPLASGNSVTVSGTTVTLTLATALTLQDTNVRVSYVKPTSNPIQDAGGTDAAAFSNQVVSNRTTDGPTLTAAEVDGTGLVLTFSDPLNTASAPASAAFTVKTGGTPVDLASSGPVAIAGSTVTLTLATAVAASDTVTVSYAVPQNNPLRGTDDMDAAAFDDRPVTNRTIAVPDAPDSFRVTAGDAQAELSWAAPSFDGNSPITKYRYRYAAGTTVPTTRAWTDVPDRNNDNSLADERNVTVTGLTNETEYAFEIQAVNSAGGGPAASASATPIEDPNLPSVVLELRAQTGDGTVTLEWGPPLRTGSHDSIDYYEYRYAAGSSVPTSTSWASADAGRHPFTRITGLENGRSYAFEVRAVNRHGYKGAVATLTARPYARVVQTLPTAPRGLRGDGSLYEEGGRTYSSVTERAQVKLSWDAPSNLGNSLLVRYEYRYAARGESLSSAAWNHGPASERTLTVRNLVAGTTYTFQLRAVTDVGAGRAASVGVTTPRSERLSLSVFTRGAAVEGENLTIGVRRSGTPNKAVLVVVDIHDSTTGRWSAKSVDIAAGAREGTVEFAVPFDGERGAARELEVTLGPDSWKPESAYRVGSPASATVRVRNRDALLRVRDATVREGPQAVLRFDVSLDRAAAGRVTVDYATSDVTATAGADYTATSDTLSFAAGEVSKTVSVAVLDDAHDEGTETLTLTLSNASGAAIDDGTATGRIINTDAMPQAWLARFGRTASDHAIQAIESRLHGDGSAQTQSHLTIAGRRVDTLFERGRYAAAIDAPADTPDPRLEPETAWARMDRLKAEALGLADGSPADSGPADGDRAGSSPDGSSLLGGGPADGGSAPRSGAAGSGAGRRLAVLLGLPDLDRGLMGSSFLYSSRADGGHAPGWLGRWTAWGQTAETRFDGADGPLSLHGEVATATVGFETRRDRWLAGVAVSYSLGDGAYTKAQAGGGTLASTLASVSPFARFELNERTSLWGVFGRGAGRLSLRPDRAEAAIEADLTNTMTAFGARTALSALAGRAGRFELSLVSDARMTSTASDTVAGLMGATGETSRVRVLLRGAGSMRLATGGALTPTLEAGLRYDGGDAETGAGVEIGAGLGYAAGRFAVQINARGLVAHEDAGYEEWGFSGAVRYRAAEDGRGMSFDLGSAWGATQSGVEGLWNRQNASGLARGVAPDAAQRLQANLGYGVQGRKGRALWVPYVGVESGEGGSRALRLGLKLASGPNVEAGLEFGRRDGGGAAGQTPERAMQLRWRLRW